MKIFISYRRADSQNITDHLSDKLKLQYGYDAIFQDTENISFGQNFNSIINQKIDQSDIILVIIGPKWAELIKDRLDLDQTDYVLHEVNLSLQKRKRIIPVLVNHAKMPDFVELPFEIAKISHFNAASLRPSPDLNNDFDRLVTVIDHFVQDVSSSSNDEFQTELSPNITKLSRRVRTYSKIRHISFYLCITIVIVSIIYNERFQNDQDSIDVARWPVSYSKDIPNKSHYLYSTGSRSKDFLAYGEYHNLLDPPILLDHKEKSYTGKVYSIVLDPYQPPEVVFWRSIGSLGSFLLTNIQKITKLDKNDHKIIAMKSETNFTLNLNISCKLLVKNYSDETLRGSEPIDSSTFDYSFSQTKQKTSSKYKLDYHHKTIENSTNTDYHLTCTSVFPIYAKDIRTIKPRNTKYKDYIHKISIDKYYIDDLDHFLKLDDGLTSLIDYRKDFHWVYVISGEQKKIIN